MKSEELQSLLATFIELFGFEKVLLALSQVANEYADLSFTTDRFKQLLALRDELKNLAENEWRNQT